MEIKNKILNKEFKHRNTIIVGDNSSGKSEILRQLLINQNNGYYFIDSVNRSFNYEKVNCSEDLEGTYKSIVKYRLSENNFNLVDTFDLYKTGMGAIEKVYFNYYKELKIMLKDFLDIDFQIIIKEDKIIGEKKVLCIDNEIEKLSSGYQAIIRLFLELIYFKNSVEANINNPVVVIDEINEFLSTKNEERILPFLIKTFENMNFIVTTHSADVVASSVDCNIIVLSGNNYECLDGNDFSSVTDVREIFEKIYNLSSSKETEEIEITLRNLLNSKISETWTEIEEDQLKNINETILTSSQRLILNQIKSW
jgi:predicted ATP-binding protein involved in virulence